MNSLPSRTRMEALYRQYFTEIRKFSPFPATISYENAVEFGEWLERQTKIPVQKEADGLDEFQQDWMDYDRKGIAGGWEKVITRAFPKALHVNAWKLTKHVAEAKS